MVEARPKRWCRYEHEQHHFAGRQVGFLSALSETGELAGSIRRMRAALVLLAGLGTVLNFLLLGGSIYMMLIYDSVLPSRSLPTLFSLLALVFIVYCFQAAFEILRSRILSDMAARLTGEFSPRVKEAVSFMALRGVPAGGDGLAPIRDLDAIRLFLSGPGPAAFMDMPWVLFFLGVLTLLHPWLGFTTLVGALALLALTAASARRSRGPNDTVIRLTGTRYSMADEARRHVEAIRALGMQQNLGRRWSALDRELVTAQDRLSDTIAVAGGIARAFRMFLQALVLSVGALLVIAGNASGGVIFASSILAARALAPIDQVVAQWKSFAAARSAWERLESVLGTVPAQSAKVLRLPPPVTGLSVEGLYAAPPNRKSFTVEGVDFSLSAGDALGIVGMSAAGKSSLVRTILGLWNPARGAIRLDGADILQWDPEELGRHFGYVPQTVELLPGSIAENIARFSNPVDSKRVLDAAKTAGVHEMIVRLPQGYDTQVGQDGQELSAGQRQRIALARALFGDPFLVVLDEPNSNLDAAGEAALDTAIQAVRKRRGIVIVVAHRRAAIATVSHVLVMRAGRMERFGKREEVLAHAPQMLKTDPALLSANRPAKARKL